MSSLDKLIHITRDRLIEVEKQAHGLRDVEYALMEAQQLKNELKILQMKFGVKMQQTSAFCHWFKLNGGCESCPMWQQKDDLSWGCKL